MRKPVDPGVQGGGRLSVYDAQDLSHGIAPVEPQQHAGSECRTRYSREWFLGVEVVGVAVGPEAGLIGRLAQQRV